MRRDLTINSLFYNLHTKTVEDLTGECRQPGAHFTRAVCTTALCFAGRGLDDLRRGVIATPLPPESTFNDDPLRVLRAVRFAHRFGFTIDDALAAAASLPEACTASESRLAQARGGLTCALPPPRCALHCRPRCHASVSVSKWMACCARPTQPALCSLLGAWAWLQLCAEPAL